jgi:thiol-disulfide isomerase/thioredoxin
LLFKKLNSYTPLAIGQNFEWFTMADTSGVAINVANTGHKIILVDFWASWCTPCRQQMPELKEIYNKFHNKGFEIVAVSLDEKIDNWKKAIVHDKVPWINVSDLKGWNSELITKSYIQSIPFNIFIDSDGKIIGIDLSMNDLLKKCKDLMPL